MSGWRHRKQSLNTCVKNISVLSICFLLQVSIVFCSLPDLLRGQRGQRVHHLSAEPPRTHVKVCSHVHCRCCYSGILQPLEGDRDSSDGNAQTATESTLTWDYSYSWHFIKDIYFCRSFKRHFLNWFYFYFVTISVIFVWILCSLKYQLNYT